MTIKGTTKSESRHFEALKYALEAISNSVFSGYVEELYLYGSYAKGTHKWNSDIDLLLVLNDRAREFKNELRLLKSQIIMPDLDAVDIDIKVVYGQAWKTSPMTYYRLILQEGKKLW